MKRVSNILFSQVLRFRDKNGNNFPDWEEKKLGEILISLSTKNYQIKSSDYCKVGQYKVVDQGQDLITGYSDKKGCLFYDYPVIVFGDHTTVIKYIDFPFIVGADGTKLLKNRNNENLKYLYYNLQYKNVKQDGYKRHFTMLSEIHLQIPFIQEQTKIATFLSSIDERIETERHILKAYTDQKKYLLTNMFI
jgi:type I restriction enzyme S subunit